MYFAPLMVGAVLSGQFNGKPLPSTLNGKEEVRARAH